MDVTPVVSIVFGTCNRLGFLERAVQSVHASMSTMSYEIVIVDAGSTDGTQEYLNTLTRDNAQNVRVIQQGARMGAVAAFNEGFRSAHGRYVAAFNDDAEYIGTPVEYAVNLLQDNRDVGQVALPYLRHMCDDSEMIPRDIKIIRGDRTPQVQVVTLPIIGTVPYANFSVMSKHLGDSLGWWGNYYHYAGDTELSARVWASGLQVQALPSELDAYVLHYEAQDTTRALNVETHLFNARWRGPNSPFLKVARSQLHPPAPIQESKGNHLRFLGSAKDARHYQREPGSIIYQISPNARHFEAHDDDLKWLLSLRKGKNKLFQKL